MRAFCSSFLAALLLLSFDAAAGDRKENCPNKTKAKRTFDAGHLAYRRGEYEDAILKFQDSYANCEKALTLLAIGNAYERLGDLKAALKHLEKYQPSAEKREREEIANRISALKSRIEEQDKAEAARQAKEEALRKAEKDRQQKEAAGSKPLFLAGWITAGVGVAALAGSAVTGGWALSLDRDLAQACVGGRCPADRGEDVNRLVQLSTATDVLWVAGSVLTAGGVAMLLLSRSGGSSKSSQSPSSGELSVKVGLGSVVLRGSF